jgi:hypothetical protein
MRWKNVRDVRLKQCQAPTYENNFHLPCTDQLVVQAVLDLHLGLDN